MHKWSLRTAKEGHPIVVKTLIFVQYKIQFLNLDLVIGLDNLIT